MALVYALWSIFDILSYTMASSVRRRSSSGGATTPRKRPTPPATRRARSWWASLPTLPAAWLADDPSKRYLESVWLMYSPFWQV